MVTAVVDDRRPEIVGGKGRPDAERPGRSRSSDSSTRRWELVWKHGQQDQHRIAALNEPKPGHGPGRSTAGLPLEIMIPLGRPVVPDE